MIIRDLKRDECSRLAEIDPSFNTDKVYRIQSEDDLKRLIVETPTDSPYEIMPPMFGSTSPNAALRYQDRFDHYDLFIVAEENDRVVGACCTFPLRNELSEDMAFMAMPGELSLSACAVDRDHRCLGIGKALLDRAKSHCIERGYSMISLWTGFDYYPAIQFYLRNGFVFSGWQYPPGCRFDQCRIYLTWTP